MTHETITDELLLLGLRNLKEELQTKYNCEVFVNETIPLRRNLERDSLLQERISPDYTASICIKYIFSRLYMNISFYNKTALEIKNIWKEMDKERKYGIPCIPWDGVEDVNFGCLIIEIESLEDIHFQINRFQSNFFYLQTTDSLILK